LEMTWDDTAGHPIRNHGWSRGLSSFLPLNRSDSFTLQSVNTDCEVITGAKTGCCKPGNETYEDWDRKNPSVLRHVLTPSQL
jgi:hypothetical protein